MDISCPRAEMRSANSYLVVTCGPKVERKLCQIFVTIVSNLSQFVKHNIKQATAEKGKSKAAAAFAQAKGLKEQSHNVKSKCALCSRLLMRKPPLRLAQVFTRRKILCCGKVVSVGTYFLVVVLLRRSKRSQVMFMAKFGPTAPNFSYD